jgi:hypothetical protein
MLTRAVPILSLLALCAGSSDLSAQTDRHVVAIFPTPLGVAGAELTIAVQHAGSAPTIELVASAKLPSAKTVTVQVPAEALRTWLDSTVVPWVTPTTTHSGSTGNLDVFNESLDAVGGSVLLARHHTLRSINFTLAVRDETQMAVRGLNAEETLALIHALWAAMNYAERGQG